ncbi:MAG TPA: hypothetical protein PLZ08_06190 [Bacillota bacterium]|jgi:hypothetical protein|nr:hypothetical protein [Bacillota bacterium]HOL09505.1 hypothetical protein [Bacillota bacterium]HPO97533.1 hypothetical protein [Bacillota bacterium]
MLESDLQKFHQELGELKNQLLSGESCNFTVEKDQYTLATKIDLTVSKLLKLLDFNVAD